MLPGGRWLLGCELAAPAPPPHTPAGGFRESGGVRGSGPRWGWVGQGKRAEPRQLPVLSAHLARCRYVPSHCRESS